MKNLSFIFTILFLSGCTTSLIALPELPEQTCPKPIKQVIAAPQVCPSMSIPAPIPKNVHIDIKYGEIVDIDAGGELLIREYASTRKIIKKLWPEQP